MDKTKYNRASKDPSQLQNFVDEVCDNVGSEVKCSSLDVEMKDSYGNVMGEFVAKYDNDEAEPWLHFTSENDTWVTDIYTGIIKLYDDNSANYTELSLGDLHLYSAANDVNATVNINTSNCADIIHIDSVNSNLGEGHIKYGYSSKWSDYYAFEMTDGSGSGIRAYGPYVQFLFEGHEVFEFSADESYLMVGGKYFSFPQSGGELLVKGKPEVKLLQLQQEQDVDLRQYDGKIAELDVTHFENSSLEVKIPYDYRSLGYEMHNVTGDVCSKLNYRTSAPKCAYFTIDFSKNQFGYIYVDLTNYVIARISNN